MAYSSRKCHAAYPELHHKLYFHQSRDHVIDHFQQTTSISYGSSFGAAQPLIVGVYYSPVTVLVPLQARPVTITERELTIIRGK